MDLLQPPQSPLVPGGKIHGIDTAIYLSWRRFHLSKSKLNNVAEMASFMAGFSVVATVELQINEGGDPMLLVAFSVTTAILVATSMLTVMIATCILPELEAVGKMAKYPSPDIQRSPHDALTNFINLSWILANTVSLFLFTLDVILMCWIKFEAFTVAACWAATGVMTPILLIIIIFGILFYRDLSQHQYDLYSKKYQEVAHLHANLELSDSCSMYNNVTSLTLTEVTERATTMSVPPLRYSAAAAARPNSSITSDSGLEYKASNASSLAGVVIGG